MANTANEYYASTRATITASPVATNSSTATTLAAENTKRKQLFLQNVGVQPVYVRLGASASNTAYNFVLSAGTAAADGKGGTSTIDFYQGIVTAVSSQSTPSIAVTEIVD